MDILFGDAVNDYTTRGWSIIPIRSGDKQPLIRWEEFQHRQPLVLRKSARGCRVGPRRGSEL